MSRLLLGWHSFLAASVLLLNDWILKECCRSVLTGKISDFAGIYLIALLVASAVISGCGRLGYTDQRKPQVLLSFVILAAAFIFVKSTQTGMNLFLDLNGMMATAGKQVFAVVSREPLPRFRRSAGVVDKTDLSALIMFPLAYLTAIWRGVIS